MLILSFILIGLAGVVAGSVALIRNVRDYHRRTERGALVTLIATIVGGLLLAAGSFVFEYRYGKDTIIVGFPIPAAAWQKHGGQWRDYAGPATLLFACANAWFAFVLPHLVLRAVRRSWMGERRREPGVP